MFCPECGSTDKEMVGTICKDCFLKEFQVLSIPSEELMVNSCAHCNSHYINGKWKDAGISSEDLIYQTLEDNIIINDLVKDIEIGLEIIKMRGSIAECHITADANVLGEPINQEFDAEVKINQTVCPDCSKYNSGYYEAVIQLRAENRELTPEEIALADDIGYETLNKLFQKSRMAYLAQRAELKEGIDYYIGSQKAARKLVSALRKHLGGTTKESPRLISQDKSTGKGLYRTWISIRLPEYHVDDFIEYNNIIAQVKSIDDNKILACNLETGDNIKILWKESDNIKFHNSINDVLITTITSKSPSEIQILDPETFQPVDLPLSENLKDLNIGSEVKVIKINNRLYILS